MDTKGDNEITIERFPDHIPNHNLDAHASGQKDGEHHGSREQGSSREVSHPSGERAHSVHFERPQGELKDRRGIK